MRIEGFDYRTLPGAGIDLNVATAGEGDPIVLLHGFPQTHVMWRKVAPALAETRTVLCPDLRGYGESDKPQASNEETYSKRTMAADIVNAVEAMGFDRFAVVGHDRGALVAIRLGLDHPDKVTHIGTLDVLPTLDMWDVLHGVNAAVAWHLYLMAQPADLPERMIKATANAFFASFLDGWGADADTIPADVRAHYLQASATAADSIVADYRASAGIDVEHDREDREKGRKLTMPVTAVQQDWGAQLGFDAAALWSAWCDDLDHRSVPFGHFMAEQAPEAILEIVGQLLKRP
ncbi:alpha/beta fold hydrolase [Tenggerimyces flavus]|uniref:Alpha/beta fold hydrolase n=1 Tax=Tenggerimyces flavus TaxID=1708749 RepID=A0ABV7YJ61_9ACTN|nr:alpha/beta hydrolase [Tenggerimyces flavus]MBM7784581.1 pimeloyl-ACP methyl ester carboxylesterase [Tenggerimyces flavus]